MRLARIRTARPFFSSSNFFPPPLFGPGSAGILLPDLPFLPLFLRKSSHAAMRASASERTRGSLSFTSDSPGAITFLSSALHPFNGVSVFPVCPILAADVF